MAATTATEREVRRIVELASEMSKVINEANDEARERVRRQRDFDINHRPLTGPGSFTRAYYADYLLAAAATVTRLSREAEVAVATGKDATVIMQRWAEETKELSRLANTMLERQRHLIAQKVARRMGAR